MNITRSNRLNWLLALTPALALSACGDKGSDDGSGGSQCIGGKCDEVAPEDFSCQNLVDGSGRGGNVLEQLSDPFAEFALKRGPDGCPESFAEVMERLRLNDTEGCDDAGSGMTTKFISETEPFAEGSGLRSVVTRRCGGRGEHELIFSLFGVRAGSPLPGAAEVMAFDPESGEYNYYEVNGNEAEFFGSSSDFIAGNGGRCKQCHTAGGLVMKELRNPWLHWEQLGDSPGRLIDDNPDDLGSSKFSRGSSMESLTKAGNRVWNERRIQLLTDAEGDFTPKDMLRPLFCGTQVMLDTISTSRSEPTRVPDGVFAHCKMFGTNSCGGTHFGESGGVSIESGVYTAATEAAGQSVAQVQEPDTVFPGVFIEPSQIDIDYMDKLVDAGVIDDDFITDVLAVDFTRAVFSDARCELLEFAPEWDDLPESGEPPAGGDTGGDTGGMDTGAGDTAGGETGSADGMGGTTGSAAATPCCEPTPGTSGCATDAALESCVCGEDDFCCTNEWDDICVQVATDSCGAQCSAAAAAPTQASGFGTLPTQREATPETLRAAFIANLQAFGPEAGTPADQLLNALQNVEDTENQRERVTAFLSTCGERPDAEFMSDVLQSIELGRRKASALHVFEFPATMATLNQGPMEGTHLDPATCELAVD